MTKVTNRQHLPALDNSKPVQNPDLLSIADKNYASTILRYSNLAILYSQLDTKDKHIVGAINEINKKVQPAKRVGETDVVGGVIIGDGLSITEEGVLSATGGGQTSIQSLIVTIYPNDWIDGDSYYYCTVTLPGVDWLPNYHILVQPQGTTDYSNYQNEYYSCNVHVEYSESNTSLSFVATLSKPESSMRICISYWQDNSAGSLSSTITNPRLGEMIYMIFKNEWDANTHIAPISIGHYTPDIITPCSQQIILPLLPTSQANIENNLALQAANIQDAGQDADALYLYAENIPTRNLQIRILLNA